MKSLIVLSIVILSVIVYLAISRKSGLKIRIAALGALALMIITVIICLFKIFGDAAAGAKVQAYPDAPVIEAAPAQSNTMALVFFIVFLLALFLVVLFLSFRERKSNDESKISINKWE